MVCEGDLSSPQWFALMVRSRSEELVSSQLSDRGFEVLFPSRLESRKRSDRVKSVRAALFPGYTFCRFAVEERFRVMATPGVSSIVGSGAVLTPIPDSEITSLAHVLRSDRQLEEIPYVEVGEQVEIVEGSLQGVQGIVSERRKSCLIVSISALGRSVAVQLNEEFVKRA